MEVMNRAIFVGTRGDDQMTYIYTSAVVITWNKQNMHANPPSTDSVYKMSKDISWIMTYNSSTADQASTSITISSQKE
jgi:hypothetical protein